MTSAPSPHLEVRVPTLLDVVRPVRKVVEALLQSAGWSEDDAADAMAPLIEDGAIELGERVELVERECCLRSARPWRATPRPA